MRLEWHSYKFYRVSSVQHGSPEYGAVCQRSNTLLNAQTIRLSQPQATELSSPANDPLFLSYTFISLLSSSLISLSLFLFPLVFFSSRTLRSPSTRLNPALHPTISYTPQRFASSLLSLLSVSLGTGNILAVFVVSEYH